MSSSPAGPRPLGVWLLTLYAALFLGILPIVSAGQALMRSTDGGPSLQTTGDSALILLAFSILIASVQAWRGRRSGRRMLLVLVTIYHVFLALLGVFYAFFVPGQQPDLLNLIGRAVVFPLLYLWYFNQEPARRFYGEGA